MRHGRQDGRLAAGGLVGAAAGEDAVASTAAPATMTKQSRMAPGRARRVGAGRGGAPRRGGRSASGRAGATRLGGQGRRVGVGGVGASPRRVLGAGRCGVFLFQGYLGPFLRGDNGNGNGD